MVWRGSQTTQVMVRRQLKWLSSSTYVGTRDQTQTPVFTRDRTSNFVQQTLYY
ncbi:rCG58708 [Rattus norvegicus]|uniref:RCG58708 n=1 Tax=Rattus norvegicus TaxID=10116 RepID=A6JL52_RAT|nr:rCG58708 [Rattus norvegicus]